MYDAASFLSMSGKTMKRKLQAAFIRANESRPSEKLNGRPRRQQCAKTAIVLRCLIIAHGCLTAGALGDGIACPRLS